MKGLKLLFAAVCCVALSAVSVSCSDDSDSTPANKPTATLTAGTATQTTLTFTITPANAEECAWVCVEAGSEIPSAEAILANTDNAVTVEATSTVEVTGLTPETEYVIVAAARQGDVTGTSAQLTMTTIGASALPAQSASAVISGGWGATKEAGLRFNTSEGEVRLAVIYDSSAKYLPAGTYKVGNSEDAGTIDNSNSDYTYFNRNGELLAITAGTMELTIEDEAYGVEFNFTADNGEKYELTYDGAIDGILFYYDLSSLTEARRVKPDGEVAGQYCIKLINAPVRTVELTLDFFADASSTTLPAGTYTYGTSKQPGTVGSASQLDITSPTKVTEQFASGTVKVTTSGETYTLEINLADATGYEYRGTYTGEIANMEREDTGDATVINFTRINPNISGNNAFVQLSNDDYLLSLDIYTDESSDLPVGTYTVGENDDEEAWIISNEISFTYLRKKPLADHQKEAITEGTLKVTKEGDDYKLEMDFTTSAGKYRGVYTGALD